MKSNFDFVDILWELPLDGGNTKYGASRDTPPLYIVVVSNIFYIKKFFSIFFVRFLNFLNFLVDSVSRVCYLIITARQEPNPHSGKGRAETVEP